MTGGVVTSQQARRLDWLATAVRIGWTGPVNTAFLAFDVAGALDEDALAAAVRHTVAAHPALRTTFEQYGSSWRAHVTDAGPTSVTSMSDAVSTVTDLIQRSTAFQPDESPRMRLSLLRREPARWFLFVEIDRLAADDWSRTTVVGDIGLAYNRIVSGLPLVEPVPDNGFLEFAAEEAIAPSPPMPAKWQALRDRLVAQCSHADVRLTPLVALNRTVEGVATNAIDPMATGALSLLADSPSVTRRAVWLTAICLPLVELTGSDVPVYLYPECRTKDTARSVGWFSGRSIVEFPAALAGRSVRDQLGEAAALLSEAQTDGRRWTELVHAACGANNERSRYPSVAIVFRPPAPEIHLAGARVVPIPIDIGTMLGPGRVLYEVDEFAPLQRMLLHHERGRFDSDTMAALLAATSARLESITSRS